MSRRIAAAVLLAALVFTAGCLDPEKKMRAGKRSASHLSLARKLMENQRMRDALVQVDMALDEDRKNVEAWLVRGQVHFAIGEYVLAIEDLDQALKLRPSFTEARSWRAWARIESGDAAGGEADYREALRDTTYTTPEKIHLNLGLLLIKEGRPAEGLDELKRAVKVNPAYARGHYELGIVQEKDGNTTGALVSYQAALGGMKDSADLNLRLALALEKTGEGARAREHFKRVIEIAPDGAEAATARDHLKRLESSS